MLILGQLTFDQRLEKAVMRLMREAPEIGGILIIGDRHIEDDDTQVPTACTDGRNEWYGRTYCGELNDGQLRFVVIHENYHKMLKHLDTWSHLWAKDPQLANVAMDFVINFMIWKTYGHTGLVDWIDGALYNPMFEGWDTARVFWHLHKTKNTPDFPVNVHPKTGTTTPVSQDTNAGTPQGGGKPTPKPFRDDHDFEGAAKRGDKEIKENAKEIDEANRQGALVAGKTGTGGDRNMDEILKPPVDFREQIREFVTTNCKGKDFSTYKKPNRRYIANDVILPTSISETVEALVAAGDMSLSIGDHERRIIIGATAKAAMDIMPEAMHVLYWDTEVAGAEVYEQDELDEIEARTKPCGGGGTDPRCIPAYLRQEQIKPNATIVATDGYVWDWGEWDHPVLWVIINNKNCVPPVGKYVHVSSGDLMT